MMAERPQHPSVVQKVAGQLRLGSSLSRGLESQTEAAAMYQGRFSYGNYTNMGFQYPMTKTRQNMSIVPSSASPVFVQAPSEKPSPSFAVDFVMGGVAAAVSKTAAAPIELVKLLKDEGIASLWRGYTANVIRYVPAQALNFAFKDLFNRRFNVDIDRDDGHRRFNFDIDDRYWKWAAGNFLCGACAGGYSLLFVHSLDYARICLANDSMSAKKGGERQFNGLVDVYRKTIKADGIAGLYRGFNISCVNAIMYHGLYFGCYDSSKALLPPARQDSYAARFQLAFVSALCAGHTTYPFEVIRRRMMTTLTSGQAVKYNSPLFDACYHLVMNEQLISFWFKGLRVNIIPAIFGAGVLVGYDELQLIVSGKK